MLYQGRPVAASVMVHRTNCLFCVLNVVAVVFFLVALAETMIFSLPATSSLASSMVARLPDSLMQYDRTLAPSLEPSASAPKLTVSTIVARATARPVSTRKQKETFQLTANMLPPQRISLSWDVSLPSYPEVLTFNATSYPLAELRLCRPLHNQQVSCDNDETCAAPKCKNANFNFNISFISARKRIGFFYKTRSSRMGQLREILEGMRKQFGPPLHNTILIMTFNAGYSYMFLNWVCSARANNVDLNPLRSSLLILATDEEARRVVEFAGFFVFVPDPLTLWAGRKIYKSAARLFGLGSHADLNMVTKFGMTHDVVELGYNVGSMDTDMVWTGNAFEKLWDHCQNQSCDAAFIWDGRPFGPAKNYTGRINWALDDPDPLFRKPIRGKNSFPQFNTGFFLIMANPRTAKLLATLMNVQFLHTWKGTDQLVFNLVLYHHLFSDLKLILMPEREFIPGGSLHVGRHVRPFPYPPELFAIHASDAASHTDKIIKLERIGHWYFTEERCPDMWAKCRLVPFCIPVDVDLPSFVRNITRLNPIH